ncbi:MAG: Hsp70 family protein, partial [Luminiphilus sp.]
MVLLQIAEPGAAPETTTGRQNGVGIDLGTTNSAVARMENGDSVIKKNDLQSDTTPSAVAFGSKGRIRV